MQTGWEIIPIMAIVWNSQKYQDFYVPLTEYEQLRGLYAVLLRDPNGKIEHPSHHQTLSDRHSRDWLHGLREGQCD